VAAEDWTMDIDGQQWVVRVHGKAAEKLGPSKKEWFEKEIRQHYSNPPEHEDPLTFAGTRYRGASGEYEVAIDYHHKYHEVTISDLA
jgi:hypothetical protein